MPCPIFVRRRSSPTYWTSRFNAKVSLQTSSSCNAAVIKLTNCYHRPSLQCHLLDTQVQNDPPNGSIGRICDRNTCTAIWADGNTVKTCGVPFQDCFAFPCGQVPHPVHSSLQELQSCFWHRLSIWWRPASDSKRGIWKYINVRLCSNRYASGACLPFGN